MATNTSKNHSSSYLLIQWSGTAFPSQFPKPYLISVDDIMNIQRSSTSSPGVGTTIEIHYKKYHGGANPRVDLEYTAGLTLQGFEQTFTRLIEAIAEAQANGTAPLDAEATALTPLGGTTTLTNINVTY